MAFTDDLARHVEQVRSRVVHVHKNEQSTKQALIVPLLQVLGYDVFDPREVRPEYEADFAVKKQGQKEKVDYAIFLNDVPVMFIECKPADGELADHDGQLSRYFNATPSVKVAVITDGVGFRAFTDLRTPNIMDPVPWFAADLLSLKPAEIEALRRFRRSDFVPAEVVALAEEMVYYNAMVEFLSRQLREPSESFVRFVATEIQAAGRVTGRIVERLSPILRKAIQSSIVEHVSRSFESPAPAPESTLPPTTQVLSPLPSSREEGTREGVTTTIEELQIFDTICSWIREVMPDAKLAFRDSKSYATVHQDNIRKWFIRFWADRKPWWVVLRGVPIAEAVQLAPGIEIADASVPGASRLSLANALDLQKARAAIILVYRRELDRKTEDVSNDLYDSQHSEQRSSATGRT